MKSRCALLLGSLLFAASPLAMAQNGGLGLPNSVQAGAAFSIQSSGSGTGTLYIVGPNQVFKKQVQLGGSLTVPAGTITHAGHYLVAVAAGPFKQTGSLDVLPKTEPAQINFLADPSRLPINRPKAITGAVYVFDSYGNLIITPTPVSFKLSTPSGSPQVRTAKTSDGAAWIRMNSTARDGLDKFVAQAGTVSQARLVRQVAGNPCQLTMNAKQSGKHLELQTNPVRDCSGNPVPDGTIVSFSETYDGSLSTADVPLKHGIAKAYLPAHRGGLLSVASGVVLGNQIRWEK